MKNIQHTFLLLYLLLHFFGCLEQSAISNVEYYQFNLLIKDKIQFNKKINLKLQAIISDSIINYRGSIERIESLFNNQGKYSYEIDLINDVSIANLPADDDWILNANNLDKSFMRNIFAYDLFREMSSYNKAAQSKFVAIQKNNKYHGLYILMEKLDKSSLQIEEKNDLAFIFKNPPLIRADKPNSPDGSNHFQQIFPKKKRQESTAFIAGVQNFIKHSESTVFSEEIATIFDINNLIDWHLLLLLTNNETGVFNNFFLYKVDDLTPLRFAPWGFENSLRKASSLQLSTNQPINIEKSILFKRLMKLDGYKKKLKKRWKDLNVNGLFTIESFHQRIDNYHSILTVLVKQDSEKGQVKNSKEFEKEVSLIKDYLTSRHEQLTKYFEKLK